MEHVINQRVLKWRNKNDWEILHSMCNYFSHQGNKCKLKWESNLPVSNGYVLKKDAWNEYGERRTLTEHGWECKLLWSQRVSKWRLLKKLEIDLPYDPVIPFLGLFAKYSVSYTGLCMIDYFFSQFE